MLLSLQYGGDDETVTSLTYLLRRFEKWNIVVIFSCLNLFCLSNIGEPFHNSWGTKILNGQLAHFFCIGASKSTKRPFHLETKNIFIFN